jgi:hypothetical protein
MKKLNFKYGVLFFISLLLFVSCMGETGNKESGYAVGVVRMEDKALINVLDVDEYTSFYSILFANTTPGACFHIYYELDYDLPENSYESVLSKGYYTISVIDKVELDRWEMVYHLSDTSQVMQDEVVLIEPISSGDFAYIKGMAFFCTLLEMPAEQKMYWTLSCDIQNYMQEEDGGQRYYDVFLRATVKIPSTKSSDRTGIINAYNMQYYLERIAQDEHSRGSNSFKIRFNYVSDIKDEKITWKQQESLPINIETILPEINK